MDQFDWCFGSWSSHYDIFPYGTYYMQHISSGSFFQTLLEATFAWLWNHVGIGTMVFWGGSIFRWPHSTLMGGRFDLMLFSSGLLSIFKEDVVHRANPMLRWVFINPLTSFQFVNHFQVGYPHTNSHLYLSWVFINPLSSMLWPRPLFVRS
jgi:hypothetical protein